MGRERACECPLQGNRHKGNFSLWALEFFFDRLLEPAQLWIFILDYSLISFAQKCSNLIFKPKHIALFSLHPTCQMLQVFCAVHAVF